MLKEYFLFALCLMLCGWTAPAAAVAVRVIEPIEFAVPLRLRGGCILVDQNGIELTGERKYVSIESIATGDVDPLAELFIGWPAYDEEQSGLGMLIDVRGNELTEPIYEQLIQEGEWIRYQKDGLQGTMNMKLEEVVPCRYRILVPNGEGGYLGIDGDPYDDEPDGIYYVDAEGVETPTGALVLGGIGEFAEGLSAATSAQTGRVGYLGAKGEWAIPAQFEYGGLFRNGRAEACIESGYGVIDRSGNWLLTPKYTLVSTGFGDGNIIIASEGERAVHLIDPATYQIKKTFSGEEIYFGAYFDRNYVVLYTLDKVQLIDEAGDVRLETDADGNFDTDYRMGTRVIMRSGPWGEVNATLMDVATGDSVAGPYRELSLLMTDDAGEPVFTCAHFEVIDVSDDDEFSEYSEVPYTRNIGILDKDGEALVPLGRFMAIEPAGHGLIYAETLYEAGLIGIDGEWVVRFDRDDPNLEIFLSMD